MCPFQPFSPMKVVLVPWSASSSRRHPLPLVKIRSQDQISRQRSGPNSRQLRDLVPSAERPAHGAASGR